MFVLCAFVPSHTIQRHNFFLKMLTNILNKIPDEEYATQLQDSACTVVSKKF